MRITYPDDEPAPSSQHNHGSGTFIGRDNYGTINTAIDETTKKILRKLSLEAPALAKLLEKALRDGLISSDTVVALETAARNINEDVANALLIAGRNINEDVANNLRRAAENIDEGTVQRIEGASTTISKAILRLEELSRTLKVAAPTRVQSGLMVQLGETADSIERHADRIEKLTALPSAQRVVAWKLTFYAFLSGILVGVLLFAYILQH